MLTLRYIVDETSNMLNIVTHDDRFKTKGTYQNINMFSNVPSTSQTVRNSVTRSSKRTAIWYRFLPFRHLNLCVDFNSENEETMKLKSSLKSSDR